MLFHIIFASLLLVGHFWHAIRARAIASGFIFSQMKFNSDALLEAQNNKTLIAGIVRPFENDPQLGNLATPINTNEITLTWLKNLPIYRPGLSPILRGLEIGMAHGYWLLGPFLKLGPLRNTPQALVAGFTSAAGLIVIASFCLFLYGSVTFQKQPQLLQGVLPENLKTYKDWSFFTSGFLIGALGGLIFACFILLEIARSGIV